MAKAKPSRFKAPFLKRMTLPTPPEDAPGYAFKIPLFADGFEAKFERPITVLVGENGSGKSTMLEALAIKLGLNPEGGSRNIQFATRETHSQLHHVLRLSQTPGTLPDAYFLRAESFYNVATEMEKLGVKDYGDKPFHEQSHGEAFFTLFNDRFNNEGIYILDEPEAALSPARQLAFLALIHEYIQGGAQFVIATHSPIIMAYPQARILHFGPEGIREQAYKETEHYRITRSFLESPERSFRELFGE